MKSKRMKPPRLAEWILIRMPKYEDEFSFVGDMEEEFIRKSQSVGNHKARLWYRRQVMYSMLSYFKFSKFWSFIMFNNYFKTTLRNIFKNKGVTFINITGLAVGMACSIIMFLWVTDQLSFDKSQGNRERIFRLESIGWVNMPTLYASVVADFPEVHGLVQFNHWENPVLKYDNRPFEIENFAFASKGVFDMFTLPFVQGNPETAFEAPFSLVLTESNARRIFGDENPLGKMITYDNSFNYTVTGILKDVEDFHVKIGALAPFEDLPLIKNRANFLSERNYNFLTYILLPENADIKSIEKKIDETLNFMSTGEKMDFILRPFKEIYFARNLQKEKGAQHGNMQLILLFSVISVLILVIACINFINLSTARSMVRSKEICVRKVTGATQSQLVKQFLFETFTISFIALLLAVLLIQIFLPVFSRIADAKLEMDYTNPQMIAGMLLIFLFTGLAAGSFPSFFLSSLNPVSALKGKSIRSSRHGALRKTLIVFQFTISIFLVAATLAVFRQMNFLKNADLGVNIDHIINIRLKGDLITGKRMVFKERLLQRPEILKASISNQVPGSLTNTNTWRVNGEPKPMIITNTDPEYLDVMDLELIEGRNFNREMITDREVTYLINEEAVKLLGFESPVGETIRANFGTSQIIGVVRNYHFNSLHKKIAPLAICWCERWGGVANIKISGKNIGETINYIEKVWTEMNPDFPFSYSFLDESFAQQYNQENRMAESLVYFVFTAIILACLGLFGLSAFIAERKTKEIGIRKVLGSKNSSIVLLLAKDFLKWVVIANIFAWPLAYIFITKWLRGYAYRANIGIAIFILSGFITMVIALFTISFQSVKASVANPVDSLKYE